MGVEVVLDQGVSFEAQTWKIARERFRAKHQGSDRDRLESFLKSHISIQQAKNACKEAEKDAGKEYSPVIGGILEKIDVAMQMGDLAMKGAPESVGLAWAAVRLCMHSINDDFATFSLFSSAGSDILGILISCGVYGKMYSETKGPESFRDLHDQVVDFIPSIYVDILEFSYQMKKHMAKNQAMRLIKGTFKSYEAQFRTYIANIKEGERKMRDFAQTATSRLSIFYHEQTLKGQDSISGQLKEVIDSFEKSKRMNEVFMKRLQQYEEEQKNMRKMTPAEQARETFEKNKKALADASEHQTATFAEKKSRRIPNTCNWIFNNSSYKAWTESESSSLLWLSGGGGFGKSILMSAVIESLKTSETQNKDKIVAYFFCNQGDDSTQKTAKIQSHLIYQMYSHCDTSTETLEAANALILRYRGGKKKTDYIKYPEAFSSLAKLCKKEVFVVIDALDECNDRREQDLLQELRDICAVSEAKIKILVCSRPESDITSSLDGVVEIKVEENNQQDIRDSATELLAKLPGWTTTERKEACESIVKKAGSYFRYVELAIKFLSQPWQRPISRRLEQLPEGLDNSYRQIVQNTDPNYLPLLRTCLHWAILAEGEITVSEVVDAYSGLYSEKHESSQEPEDSEGPAGEQDITLWVEQIRFAGSSLLEVNSETGVISLRHSTVSEYFLRKTTLPTVGETTVSEELCAKCGSKKHEGDPIGLNEKDGHLEIATVILQHLLSPQFQKRYLANEMAIEKALAEATAKAEEEVDAAPTGNESEDVQSKEEGNTSSGVPIPENDETEPNDDKAEVPTEIPDTEKLTTEANEPDGKEPDVPTLDADISNDTGNTDINSGTNGTECSSAGTEDQGDIKPNDGDSETAAESDDDSRDSDAEEEYDDDNYAKVAEADTEDSETRYEVSNLLFHLQKVEALWAMENRTGTQWTEYWSLVDKFFKPNSRAFRLWARKYAQIGPGFKVSESSTITPLHVVAAWGLVGIFELLKEADEDHSLAAKTLDGRLPLHFAATTVGNQKVAEKLDIIRCFLESGADPNATDSRQWLSSPFHTLLYRDPNAELVELFIKHGADVNLPNTSGLSPLHFLVTEVTHMDAVRALINAGADLNAKDSYGGETPLHWILVWTNSSSIRQEFVKLAIEHGADIDAEDMRSQRPLFEAAWEGEVEVIDLLLDANADVQDDDVEGYTALHISALKASSRKLETVKRLIKGGADITKASKKGYTPFFLACLAGNEETAEYLLSASGAEIPDIAIRPDKKGKTPLMKAAAKNHLKVMEMLLKRPDVQETIDAGDKVLGMTALHKAAQNVHTESVKLLLDNGASSTIKNQDGVTPLMLCCQNWSAKRSERYADTVSLLLKHYRPNVTESTEILNTSTICGSVPVIESILALGADPNRRDEHGWSAIELARHYNQKAALEVLQTAEFKGFKAPARFVSSLHKDILISEDGMELEHLREVDKKQLAWGFITDHPIPIGSDNYYFEVEVLESGKDRPHPFVAVGLSHRPAKTSYWVPAWRNPWSLAAFSWAYQGGDGSLGAYSPGTEIKNMLPGNFGPGDVIGCGVDLKKGTMFFTRNGERLMPVGFTKVFGRLHPAIGLAEKARVRVNLGAMPFKWQPGNSKDFDAVLEEKVEEVGNKPKLFRSKTVAM